MTIRRRTVDGIFEEGSDMNIHPHRLVTGIAAILATGMLMASSACGTGDGSQSERPSAKEPTGPITVVASINQWGSLAEQIGGTDVNVTSILSSTNVDAHDFEPKTSDVAKLQKAQIIVSNGAGYDSWATKSVGRNSTIVSAAETVGAMEGDNPHLWFSKDARNGMATELTEAFSKALPAKKKAFQSRLKAWQKEEKAIEKSMGDFAANHNNATYGATEAVAYYLMSDMGFQDDTPKGFAQSVASGGEPAPADLQKFQSLIESQGISVLVNNTQESSDATNMLTGTAGRAGVPVFDVSEQMPQAYTTLTDWIADLVARLDKTVSPAIIDDSDESGSSDGKDGASAKNDAGNSADDKSDTAPAAATEFARPLQTVTIAVSSAANESATANENDCHSPLR